MLQPFIDLEAIFNLAVRETEELVKLGIESVILLL